MTSTKIDTVDLPAKTTRFALPGVLTQEPVNWDRGARQAATTVVRRSPRLSTTSISRTCRRGELLTSAPDAARKLRCVSGVAEPLVSRRRTHPAVREDPPLTADPPDFLPIRSKPA